jgi:hypothetical protein
MYRKERTQPLNATMVPYATFGATRMAKCQRGRASLEEKVYRPRKSITQVIHSAQIHSAQIILLAGLDHPFGGCRLESGVRSYRG